MPAALCWWARSRLIMIPVTTIPVFLDVCVAWTCCVVYYLLWSVVFLFQLIHMPPQNVPVLLTCAVCLSFFFTKVHHMISLLLHNVAAGLCSAVLCWILPNSLLWDQICSHWRKLSTSTKTSWYIRLESSSFVISSLAITRFCLGEWDSIACWFCYTSDHEVHAVIFVVHFLLWSLELCLEQMW